MLNFKFYIDNGDIKAVCWRQPIYDTYEEKNITGDIS